MSRKENIVIIIFILVIIFSFLSAGWIVKNSETSQNQAIVDEEFINYATKEVMISNISHIRGEEIAADIRDIDGVHSVIFDNSKDHYRDTSALFVICFDDGALEEIKRTIEPYDVENRENRIREKFGSNNTLELILPSGDYESEKQLLDSLSRYREVDSVKGLSNIETTAGYTLTESLQPEEFSQLMKLNDEIIIEEAALIDMVASLYTQAKEGYVRLDNEYMMELEEYHRNLNRLKGQMQGENYSRIFIKLDLPVEGEESSEFVWRIYSEAGMYYDLDSVFLVGDSVSALEGKGVSFETD